MILKNTGPANLRYLCERAKLEYRPGLDSAEQLANRLLSSQSKDEIVFLATFLCAFAKMRLWKSSKKVATEAEKSVLESDLAEYSGGRAETLKPFTKLVWLYSANPDSLEAIHFCHAWRRLPSSRSYTTPEPLTLKTFTALREGMGRLVSRLNKVRAGETYEDFGSSQMTDTLTIFVVHRCFPPSVRSDYQQDFRVQRDFSTIAFAVDVATSSFVLKIANRALGDTVRDWISDELQITLEDAGTALFNDYEPYSVEHAFARRLRPISRYRLNPAFPR